MNIQTYRFHFELPSHTSKIESENALLEALEKTGLLETVQYEIRSESLDQPGDSTSVDLALEQQHRIFLQVDLTREQIVKLLPEYTPLKDCLQKMDEAVETSVQTEQVISLGFLTVEAAKEFFDQIKNRIDVRTTLKGNHVILKGNGLLNNFDNILKQRGAKTQTSRGTNIPAQIISGEIQVSSLIARLKTWWKNKIS